MISDHTSYCKWCFLKSSTLFCAGRIKICNRNFERLCVLLVIVPATSDRAMRTYWVSTTWKTLSWRKDKAQVTRTALFHFHKDHDFSASQNLPFTKWLQTAVSKPSDWVSMEPLGWREAIESTPSPAVI